MPSGAPVSGQRRLSRLANATVDTQQPWVHAVPRPVAVEAAGEDGLSRVKSEEMPCDEHHASVLRTAAQMMHRDMLAPVAESRDRLNDMRRELKRIHKGAGPHHQKERIGDSTKNDRAVTARMSLLRVYPKASGRF